MNLVEKSADHPKLLIIPILTISSADMLKCISTWICALMIEMRRRCASDEDDVMKGEHGLEIQFEDWFE